jgi:hypothetical protein
VLSSLGGLRVVLPEQVHDVSAPESVSQYESYDECDDRFH